MTEPTCTICGGRGVIPVRVGNRGMAKRCVCKERLVVRQWLGHFYTPAYEVNSELIPYLSTDVWLEGAYEVWLPKIAGAVLSLTSAHGKKAVLYHSWQLWRGINDGQSRLDYTTPDLLILTVGTGDGGAKGGLKITGDLVTQCLEQRHDLHRPTWLVTSLSLIDLSARYSEQLSDAIRRLRHVQLGASAPPVPTPTPTPEVQDGAWQEEESGSDSQSEKFDLD